MSDDQFFLKFCDGDPPFRQFDRVRSDRSVCQTSTARNNNEVSAIAILPLASARLDRFQSLNSFSDGGLPGNRHLYEVPTKRLFRATGAPGVVVEI